MARVFLTGAAGFLGTQVSERLRRLGHNVTQTPGDLLDARSYRNALRGADCVVHLAAATGRASAAEFARVNVDGTRTLVEESTRAGVSRFLYCSTIAVTFRDLRGYPYAQTKTDAEQVVAQSSLRTTIVRPTILGGAGSPVLEKLAALARLPIVPLFGGGRARVQPIHVVDAAAIIATVVDADHFEGPVVELGGPTTVTIRELIERLRRHQGAGPPRFVPVPLEPLLPAIALGERLLGQRWPLAVGQLATFRFDGVARPHPLVDAARGQMVSLDQMIAEVCGP
jgi:nucleoside-diphosphate-sugar epimerase